MKEITKKFERTEIWYEAIDGTEFKSKEQCAEYENTAKCVLFSRYQKLVVKSTDNESLFYSGSGIEYIDIVKLESEADVTIILQLLAAYNSYLFRDDTECLNIMKKSIEDALSTDGYLLINRGNDCEDNFVINKSLSQIINHLKSVVNESSDN